MNSSDSIPLYWEHPYLTEMIVKVLAIKDKEIKVDNTLFYPGGGGQLADTGILIYQEKEIKIIGTEKRDEEIWLLIESNLDNEIKEGTEILIKLDWDRRYSFMRAHTAQHLFSHTLKRLFDIDTLKSNIEEEYIHIDISYNISEKQLLDVLEIVNKAVFEGAPVKSIIISQDEYQEKYRNIARGKVSSEDMVRLINIKMEGREDLTCCGGVHINNLSEIKGIFLDSFKDDTIKLFIDKHGINTANEQRIQLINLEILTAKKGEKMYDMLANKMNEVTILQEANLKLLKMIFNDISNWSQDINNNKIVFLELQEIDRQALQSAAKELMEGYLIVVLGRNDILYLISSSEKIDAQMINKKIMEKTGLKGGGNRGFAQSNIKNVKDPLSLVEEVLKTTN